MKPALIQVDEVIVGEILIDRWQTKKKGAVPIIKREGRFMNSSTKDKIKGRAKEALGKVKEETGEAIGNPDLRDRGTDEKVAGKVQRKNR